MQQCKEPQVKGEGKTADKQEPDNSVLVKAKGKPRD